MNNPNFGWDLPPGCSQRDIDNSTAPRDEDEERASRLRDTEMLEAAPTQAKCDACAASSEEFFAAVNLKLVGYKFTCMKCGREFSSGIIQQPQ